MTSEDPNAVSPEELAQAIQILERIAQDRGVMLEVPKGERDRLMRAAGRVANPGRAARRQLAQAQRRQQKQQSATEKQADELLLAQTGMRQPLSTRRIKLAAPPEPMPLGSTPGTAVPETSNETSLGTLKQPRNCYICKGNYREVHLFYDALCPECAEFNWAKRQQTADLSGRYVLVTGGRVKIGYHAALKMLRAGAHVVVTSRFPRNAVQRFAAEADSAQWLDRLQLHGLDLRHIRSVEVFADFLSERLPRLDCILNNACQTVRRPPGFYAHLMAEERQSLRELPLALQNPLAEHEALRGDDMLCDSTTQERLPAEVASSLAGLQRAAELSQIALAPDDETFRTETFPTGKMDEDAQQVDLRTINSWRLKLADVPTVELLEVQLVNAIAPFVLNARLKPLMRRVPTMDKHIVNVSAMEGVFYRAFKRDTHPHTNMAKAALNMLTRTSAADYVQDGIHMNSVDTGWITDEDPIEIARRKRQEHDFHPPLDHVDAAARICDPFFSGLLTGEHVWGKFLKDYQVSNW